MSNETEFYPGEIVFDKRRTSVTDDTLVVTDASIGELGSISETETYEHVKSNDTNQQLNPEGNTVVPDDVRLIKAAYVNDDDGVPVVGATSYPFPEYRLATVATEEDDALASSQPHQLALAQFYSELATQLRKDEITIETPRDLKLLAMKAEIDGGVIHHAEEKMEDTPPVS